MARKFAKIRLSASSVGRCPLRKSRRGSPRQMLELALANTELPAKSDELAPMFARIDPRNQNAFIIPIPVEGANPEVLVDVQVAGDISKQPRPRAANCLSGALFRFLV